MLEDVPGFSVDGFQRRQFRANMEEPLMQPPFPLIRLRGCCPKGYMPHWSGLCNSVCIAFLRFISMHAIVRPFFFSLSSFPFPLYPSFPLGCTFYRSVAPTAATTLLLRARRCAPFQNRSPKSLTTRRDLNFQHRLTGVATRGQDAKVFFVVCCTVSEGSGL